MATPGRTWRPAPRRPGWPGRWPATGQRSWRSWSRALAASGCRWSVVPAWSCTPVWPACTASGTATCAATAPERFSAALWSRADGPSTRSGSGRTGCRPLRSWPPAMATDPGRGCTSPNPRSATCGWTGLGEPDAPPPPTPGLEPWLPTWRRSWTATVGPRGCCVRSWAAVVLAWGGRPDPVHGQRDDLASPRAPESPARGRWSWLEAGELERLQAVAAVAQGNDPSLANGEHAVGAVIPTSAEMGVDPWRPHTDHDQLAVAGDLLEFGPQAVLGPVPQHLLQLLAAVADLRGRVLQGRIQVGPLQVRVDQLQHRG